MINISRIFYDIGQGSWVAIGFAGEMTFRHIPISVNCAKWLIQQGCQDITSEKHSAMIPDIHSIY